MGVNFSPTRLKPVSDPSNSRHLFNSYLFNILVISSNIKFLSKIVSALITIRL